MPNEYIKRMFRSAPLSKWVSQYMYFMLSNISLTFSTDGGTNILTYKNCFVTSCSLELSFGSAVKISDEVKRQA